MGFFSTQHSLTMLSACLRWRGELLSEVPLPKAGDEETALDTVKIQVTNTKMEWIPVSSVLFGMVSRKSMLIYRQQNISVVRKILL